MFIGLFAGLVGFWVGVVVVFFILLYVDGITLVGLWVCWVWCCVDWFVVWLCVSCLGLGVVLGCCCVCDCLCLEVVCFCWGEWFLVCCVSWLHLFFVLVFALRAGVWFGLVCCLLVVGNWLVCFSVLLFLLIWVLGWVGWLFCVDYVIDGLGGFGWCGGWDLVFVCCLFWVGMLCVLFLIHFLIVYYEGWVLLFVVGCWFTLLFWVCGLVCIYGVWLVWVFGWVFGVWWVWLVDCICCLCSGFLLAFLFCWVVGLFYGLGFWGLGGLQLIVVALGCECEFWFWNWWVLGGFWCES